LFISTKKPQGLTKRGLQHIISRISAKGGVRTESGNKVSPHKLRHTFATNLYNKNPKVDVLILGNMLGHSNPNSTKIYTTVNRELIKDIMDNTDMYDLKENTKSD
jgi:site-specific recombinase XerD